MSVSAKVFIIVLIFVHVIPLLVSFPKLHGRLGQPKANRDAGKPGGCAVGKAAIGAKDGCGLNLTDAKQKSSNIAQKAALDAKAASDAQVPAAKAAALHVKSELADKAAKSARAAEAALAAKKQIVDQLEQKMKEANATIVVLTASLQKTQYNADLAARTARVAETLLKNLKALVVDITSTLGTVQKMAVGVQQQIAEGNELLEAAKRRVENKTRRVAEAQLDYDKTKEAATKAACAAMEAMQNAKPRNRRNISCAQ